ncbi:hypothetical protein LINPERHAP2_LOCUS5703 [Linum perenne]
MAPSCCARCKRWSGLHCISYDGCGSSEAGYQGHDTHWVRWPCGWGMQHGHRRVCVCLFPVRY